MKRQLLSILMVLIMEAVSGTVLAEEPKGTEGLKVTSSAKRQVEVVNEKGEKEVRLESVAAAVPGEELVMLITYVNQGREPARNVSLVNPIPAEMVYVGGSAQGEGTVVAFSIDGGRTYESPGNLFVVQADGTRRQAAPGEYTHIRWLREGPLAPDGQGEARFRVIIK